MLRPKEMGWGRADARNAGCILQHAFGILGWCCSERWAAMADDPASAKAGGTADRPSKGSGDPEPPYHGFLSGLPAKPPLEMALELAHGAAFWFNEAGKPELAEEIHRIMRGVAEPSK